jgi:hypothetical protein
MLDNLIMKYRTRILYGPDDTDPGVQYYKKPTAGVMSIIIRIIVKMADAADLTLALKYADDASGTNAAAFDAVSPLFVDGVKQTAAKTYAITASSGTSIVDFVVDPALVPADKYVGLSFATSHANTHVCVEMIEEMGIIPTAT